jgi:hypothetical protein
MAVFIGGITGNGVPTITQSQYAKLKKIEDAALKYYYTLKGDYYSSRKLNTDYYYKWDDMATKLGIKPSYGEQVRYRVEGMGEKGDFSYGYQFYELFG